MQYAKTLPTLHVHAKADRHFEAQLHSAGGLG